MTRFVGFNPPFIGGNENIMSQQRDEKLIRNDILQNLLITPGELPFRPNFGTNIRNFVFDPMSQNDLSSLENEIRTQIVKNDNRLIIKMIKLEPDQDRSRLTIKIIVSFKEDPLNDIEINRLINTPSRTT